MSVRLGSVIHRDPKGNLVVKAESVPRLGASVFDRKGVEIGKIFDIIGNVKAPYLVIKPSGKRTADNVYILGGKQKNAR